MGNRFVWGAAVSMLADIGGCGGNSSSGPSVTALSATSTVSNTDPASVAVATSQSVPNVRMQAVLDQLTALGAKPIETLSVVQARTQPLPADAVKALLVKKGKIAAPEPGGSAVDTTFAGSAGLVPAQRFPISRNKN